MNYTMIKNSILKSAYLRDFHDQDHEEPTLTFQKYLIQKSFGHQMN